MEVLCFHCRESGTCVLRAGNGRINGQLFE
jgi:hypothetical protein